MVSGMVLERIEILMKIAKALPLVEALYTFLAPQSSQGDWRHFWYGKRAGEAA